jgi:Holliday junction DNA helicase RuvA
MIGKLKGLIEEKTEDSLLLDVQGVCYLVFLSGRALQQLPGEGEAAALFIETHVREDHIHLYGFPTAEDRAWFRLLSTVQGVGAKMALAILDAFATAELSQAILAKDSKMLTRASGVGPKLAERLITELKNKVTKMAPTAGGSSFAPAAAGSGRAAGEAVPSSAIDEAVSALVNLGYGRSEAMQAVSLAHQQQGELPSVEGMIRDALKELAA